jgi:hypothetical protein
LLDAQGLYAPDYKEPEVVVAVKCGDETYTTLKHSTVNPVLNNHYAIGMRSAVNASNSLLICVLHNTSVLLGSVSVALEPLLGQVTQKLQLPLRGGTLEDNGDVGYVCPLTLSGSGGNPDVCERAWCTCRQWARRQCGWACRGCVAGVVPQRAGGSTLWCRHNATRHINVEIKVRSSEPPLLCGNLSKLGGAHGGKKNWKVRFFVLEDDTLSYFDNEKACV